MRKLKVLSTLVILGMLMAALASGCNVNPTAAVPVAAAIR